MGGVGSGRRVRSAELQIEEILELSQTTILTFLKSDEPLAKKADLAMRFMNKYLPDRVQMQALIGHTHAVISDDDKAQLVAKLTQLLTDKELATTSDNPERPIIFPAENSDSGGGGGG